MHLGWLRSQGIGPGDRIALQMAPSQEWIDLFLAAMKIGAVVSPLPLKAPVEPLLKRLSPKLWIDPASQAHALPQKPLLIPESSVLLFTSGSSGTPKIAVLSFDSLLKSAKAVVNALSIQSNDCLCLSLPLHHVGGIGLILRSWLSGARITFSMNDPEITILSQVPTQLYRAWPIHSRLRAIMLGGAPIPQIPSQLPIFATYGLTEMGSTVLLRKHPPELNGLFHLGFPLPHARMKLAPDGEILVSGESLFNGYLEEGEIVPPDDWFATKDLGEFDATEGFAIIGRKDNLFISGGENIQPEDIERELLQHPAILEAVVVPKKDPEFGTKPVALLRTSSSLSLQEIQRFLQHRLPKHKIPVSLHPFPDTDLKPNRKQFFELVNRSN